MAEEKDITTKEETKEEFINLGPDKKSHLKQHPEVVVEQHKEQSQKKPPR